MMARISPFYVAAILRWAASRDGLHNQLTGNTENSGAGRIGPGTSHFHSGPQFLSGWFFAH
jgi:hypothetical protein